jgi:hypothetical protein
MRYPTFIRCCSVESATVLVVLCLFLMYLGGGFVGICNQIVDLREYSHPIGNNGIYLPISFERLFYEEI